MLRTQHRWRSRLAYAEAILLVAAVTLLSSAIAAAEQPARTAEARKVDLENQKLQLEIDRLRDPPAPWWLSGILGVVAGVGSTVVTLLVARRNLVGALDQSVHDERLKAYPALVHTAEPLAIYFPARARHEPLGPEQCREMGRAMSDWYFTHGGLLLSEASRPAYFLFARALTRASMADRINAPSFPKDADAISNVRLGHYRNDLNFPKVIDDAYVEDWVFGRVPAQDAGFAEQIRDYVLLQWLSSTLRTTLTEDLRSRLRPAS
jgi:hypothetical protein